MTKILVTGATGFIAGNIIKKLIAEGVEVHAAVRDVHNEEKLKYLKRLSPNIKFFESDLMKDGSFFDAMQGCDYVIHTASPLIAEPTDPLNQLVIPAVTGVENVLKSVNKTSTVKRVVMISSCAAVYGDDIDLLKTKDGIFTEENWNSTSSLTNKPYSYSKTLAEQKAWEINKTQDRWDLVTINPSVVLGDPINPHATSESLRLIHEIAKGTFRFGIADVEFGIVNVIDVAEACYNACIIESAKGRHILNKRSVTLKDLVNCYYKTIVIPKWIIWLVGPFISSALNREYVQKNIGHHWVADNSKSIRELKINYHPIVINGKEF